MKRTFLILIAATLSLFTFGQTPTLEISSAVVHDEPANPRAIKNNFTVSFGVPIGGIQLDGYTQGTGFGVELSNNMYVGDENAKFRAGLNANWFQANYYRKMTDSTLTGIVEYHILKIGPMVTFSVADGMDASIYANIDPVFSFGLSQDWDEGLSYSGVPLYAFGGKFRYDNLLLGVETSMGRVGYRSSKDSKPGLKDFQRYRIYFGFQF
jgi:hypothetical protein